MRAWLFYKATPDGSKIELRRVENGHVTTHLPTELYEGVTVPPGATLDSCVQAAVRKSGWVGQPPRPADSDVGRAILQGRW
jgi:hypothetical protein